MPAKFHCGINDVLLTGFAVAVAEWRKRAGFAESGSILLDMEGHGRSDIFEGIDLSRTVGWFTSLFPVSLNLGKVNIEQALMGQKALDDALQSVKEQLAQVPDAGIGFGLLRYLNAETAEELARFEAPQIRFNYLGCFPGTDGPYRQVTFEEGLGRAGMDPDISPANRLEVNASPSMVPKGPISWRTGIGCQR